MFSRRSILAGGSALIPLAQAKAQATSFPDRAIRIVVAFPPGGPSDIIARALAKSMSESFQRPVVVDNRPGGAGGTVGNEIVARAAPDGYTLALAGITIAIAPSVYPRVPYDPVADFTPISMLGFAPLIVVVHPSLPVSTMGELIALARREPGRLSYASTGIGTSVHLFNEMFKQAANVDILHVPYRGSGPAMVAMAAGEVQVMIEAMPAALPLVRAGQLRLLAVTSPQRLPEMPDVPTVAESVPGYEAAIWWGLFGPGRMPADVVRVLNTAVHAALRDPEVRASFERHGLQQAPTTSEEFARIVREDVARFRRVAQEVGIRVEN